MAKKKSQPATSRQAKIQAAAPALGPNKILIGAVIAVVAILVLVGGVIWMDSKNKDERSSGGNAVPAAAGAMGEGFVSHPEVTLKPGAPTLDIYEDYQCPYCGQAHAVFADAITTMAKEGTARVVYHFKLVIDNNMQTEHSLNAAVAGLCAADAGQDKFDAFHDFVFSNQPAQEGAGWTDAQYESWAEESGITGEALDTWKTCVKDERYAQYVRSTEESSARAGVTGTPQYKINGENVNFQTVNTPELLTQAIADATQK